MVAGNDYYDDGKANKVVSDAAEVAGDDVIEDNNGSSSSLHDYREHITYSF